MNLVTCKCPNCNASIKLNETLEKGTCNYCGAEVYNENALQKEKIEISGEVTIDNYNVAKKVDIARKYFDAKEYKKSFKLLNEILEKDPFNYDALKLAVQYLVKQAKVEDLVINDIYINRFKTMKKTSDDDALLAACKNIQDEAMKKWRIGIIIFLLGSLLIFLSFNLRVLNIL